MNGYQIRTKSVFLPVLAMFLLLSCLWFPSPGVALMALPDIGIDYQTMKVTSAAKLTEAGMANVRNGDAVSMRLSREEGKIIFRNLRTNEELVYPPAKPKGRET
jgi:hypothetical protein